MKKVFILLLCCVCMVETNAQNNRNELQAGAELVVPHNYIVGYSIDIKWLYSLGKSGKLTLSAGKARSNSSMRNNGTHVSWLRTNAVLLGYRHSVNKFYFEPQTGYGQIAGRGYLQGGYFRQSYGAFFWGGAAGLQLKRFDIGLRYQSAHRRVHRDIVPIDWEIATRKFRFGGIRVGYNLLGIGRKK